MVLGKHDTDLILERDLIESARQDRFHRAIREAADMERAAAGGFEPLGSVALAQAKETETGAVSLLGMRTHVHDPAGEFGGVGPGFLGPADDARGRPLEMALVGLRSV